MPAVCVLAMLLASAICTPAEDADARRAMEGLQKRNATLEELVRQQQSVIDGLNRRVTAIEQTGGKQSDNDDSTVKNLPKI